MIWNTDYNTRSCQSYDWANETCDPACYWANLRESQCLSDRSLYFTLQLQLLRWSETWLKQDWYHANNSAHQRGNITILRKSDKIQQSHYNKGTVVRSGRSGKEWKQPISRVFGRNCEGKAQFTLAMNQSFHYNMKLTKLTGKVMKATKLTITRE